MLLSSTGQIGQESQPPLAWPGGGLTNQQETEVFLRWVDGKLNTDVALVKLTPLFERLALWSARKHRLPPELLEDCQQELVISVLVSARYAYDPKHGSCIGTFLSGYAWRIGAHLARRATREIPIDILYDETLSAATDAPWMSGDGMLSPSPETLMERRENGVLDRERRATVETQSGAIDRALAAIDPAASRQQKHAHTPSAACNLDALPGKTRVGTKARSQFNMRLRLARRAMGLTRRAMAQSLGMPLWRYTKYESGRADLVPEAVYEQIQALSTNLAHRRRITEAFARYAMSEIVAYWTSLLEQAGCACAPADVRKVLEISPRTMQRWSHDFYKPKENIVVYHHEKVEDVVKAHAPHVRTLPE